jgi:YHS domain-containing protein
MPQPGGTGSILVAFKDRIESFTKPRSLSMKSIRFILFVTAAFALMAGASWAKDHSSCPNKKDSTAVCQKANCDSTCMKACGHVGKKDSTAACHKAACDSAATCKHAQMKGHHKKDQKTGTAVEQTTCPVMGNPINKDIFVEYNGKKVYFCCEQCKAEFLKAPEKYPLKK